MAKLIILESESLEQRDEILVVLSVDGLRDGQALLEMLEELMPLVQDPVDQSYVDEI